MIAPEYNDRRSELEFKILGRFEVYSGVDKNSILLGYEIMYIGIEPWSTLKIEVAVSFKMLVPIHQSTLFISQKVGIFM
jgi:hypothetical protein